MPNPDPLHARTAEAMRQRIRNGSWATGSMLPGRHVLAKELAVSLRTIERAVDGLIGDGWLRAEDRRGTFVVGVPAGEATFAAPRSLHGSVAIVSQCETEAGSGGLLDGFWSVDCLRACERSLSASGLRTRFYNVEHGPLAYPTPSAALAAAVKDGFDALAVLNCIGQESWVRDVATAITALTVPVVYVSDAPVTLPCCVLHGDHRRAGADAARHLLAAGYVDIIALAPYATAWSEARWTGAEEAVAQHPGARMVRACSGRSLTSWYEMPAQEQTSELLRLVAKSSPSPTRPTAVLACNDPVALVWWSAMRSVPGRPGLLGFDDSMPARLAGVSSMAPAINGLGEQAGLCLAGALRGQPLPASIILPAMAVARDSTDLRRKAS